MKTFRLGLTGSIGMGKSTAAGIFAAHDVPVWDADAAVHRLYAKGGAAVPAVAADFPDCIIEGAVSRDALKRRLAKAPSLLARLESLIHPLVAEDRSRFLATSGADLVVLDIPLLFEKATESDCDAVLLVTAPPAEQRRRVLARPGMTEAQFQMILSRQMPDREKRARADHIVETLSLGSTKSYIQALISHIRAGLDHA